MLFLHPGPTRNPPVWQSDSLRIVESIWEGLDTSGPEFKHAYRRTAQRSPFGLAQGRYRLVAFSEANEVVGMAEAVCRFRGKQPGLVLSYAVRPDWLGCGIGTLCTAHAVIGGLQRFHDADVIWAEIYPDNKASARLAARLGLHAEPGTDEGDLAVFSAAEFGARGRSDR